MWYQDNGLCSKKIDHSQFRTLTQVVSTDTLIRRLSKYFEKWEYFEEVRQGFGIRHSLSEIFLPHNIPHGCIKKKKADACKAKLVPQHHSRSEIQLGMVGTLHRLGSGRWNPVLQEASDLVRHSLSFFLVHSLARHRS